MKDNRTIIPILVDWDKIVELLKPKLKKTLSEL